MKILVVDDEELICWSLKRTFERFEGCSVCCAYTGNEAIQKIMENQYDVVITDLKLPDVNGHEVVKKIKELGVDVFIIVISSYLSHNILSDMLKYGVKKCVNKPFQIEDIINYLHQITPIFRG